MKYECSCGLKIATEEEAFKHVAEKSIEPQPHESHFVDMTPPEIIKLYNSLISGEESK